MFERWDVDLGVASMNGIDMPDFSLRIARYVPAGAGARPEGSDQSRCQVKAADSSIVFSNLHSELLL